jgi:hypothetical protein
MHETAGPIELIVHKATELPERLSNAEAALRCLATETNAGILVTRHNFHRYTLALDRTVPFGETHEKSVS